ncbi:MAG: hypothetical protein OHK0031_05840 [Anaerolineales bacterium]
MKKTIPFLLLALLLAGIFAPLSAQAAPAGAVRPQVAVRNYRSNEGPISYGMDFNLIVTLKNDTDVTAQRVQVSFSAPELTPRKTGGMVIVGDMAGFATSVVSQPMTVTAYLFGKKNITVEMNLLYYDGAGVPYSEKLSLLLPVSESVSYYKTLTPTPFSQAQMVITEYKTDVEPLQPGMLFNLDVKVQNLGTAPARRVTMIVGGGTASGGGGTPTAGGVSGGGGEFTNFAPVGASNVQVLGDLAVGSTLEARQNLVVNVSTAPGAYPMKITFSYADNSGNIVNDEQVITLLVFSLPNLDIGFYQPVGALMAGQPNPLPLQVVNLGKKAAVLGNLRIESDNGLVENNQTLVGALDTGGYFTYDSLVTPDQPGPLNLTVTIDYTDDFNQARSVTKTLTLEVMEAPVEPTLDPNLPVDPNAGGGGGATEESFWQKAWRFILGIFGLDSAAPATDAPTEPAPQNIPVGPVRGPKG